MKQFVLDYARYRRLGFDQLESIDLALSRRNVTPVTTARLAREKQAIAARAQLRIVQPMPSASSPKDAAAPVGREWGGSQQTAAGEKKHPASDIAPTCSDVANKAFSPSLPGGFRADGRRHFPQLRKEGDL